MLGHQTFPLSTMPRQFQPEIKPWMMVSYKHNSKTLWRLWHPKWQRVKTESEVFVEEDRNPHMCVSIKRMRVICLDNQMIRNMLNKQIPEMSLSTIANLRS